MDIEGLLQELQKEDLVYLQCHNFPDPDAICCSFSFQHLLKIYEIDSKIVYDGDIQRDSLQEVVENIGVDVRKSTVYDIQSDDKIVILDGCKGNRNVATLPGDYIAVIDHHQVPAPDDVPYLDIRPEYGSCCTVIFTYYEKLNIPISKEVATALLIGINMDTALLTRGVCEHDVRAYVNLYHLADTEYVNFVMRNFIRVDDLPFYQHVIRELQVKDELGFCYFENGCGQNLLGILGDFVLALEEIDFVVLCANNGGKVNFSIRSEVVAWNASDIVQELLKGIGFGGGHADMAGGFVQDVSLFDPNAIFERTSELLKMYAKKEIIENTHV